MREGRRVFPGGGRNANLGEVELGCSPDLGHMVSLVLCRFCADPKSLLGQLASTLGLRAYTYPYLLAFTCVTFQVGLFRVGNQVRSSQLLC